MKQGQLERYKWQQRQQDDDLKDDYFFQGTARQIRRRNKKSLALLKSYFQNTIYQDWYNELPVDKQVNLIYKKNYEQESNKTKNEILDNLVKYNENFNDKEFLVFKRKMKTKKIREVLDY